MKNLEKLEEQYKLLGAKIEKLKSQNNEFEIDYKRVFVQLPEGICTSYQPINIDIFKHGTYRSTRELAKRKAKTDQQKNRLEELAHWLEPDWEPDWSDSSEHKYYICYDYVIKAFETYANSYVCEIGKVYMSEKTAEKICKELNNPTCEQTRELAEILKG